MAAPADTVATNALQIIDAMLILDILLKFEFMSEKCFIRLFMLFRYYFGCYIGSLLGKAAIDIRHSCRMDDPIRHGRHGE